MASRGGGTPALARSRLILNQKNLTTLAHALTTLAHDLTTLTHDLTTLDHAPTTHALGLANSHSVLSMWCVWTRVSCAL